MPTRRNPPPPYGPEGQRLASHFSEIENRKYRSDMRHALRDFAEMLSPLEAWFTGRYGVSFPSDMGARGYADAWMDAHDHARRHYVALVDESSGQEDVPEYALLGAEAMEADAAAWAAGTIAGALYESAPLPTKPSLRAINTRLDSLQSASQMARKEQGRHTRTRAKLARRNRLVQ